MTREQQDARDPSSIDWRVYSAESDRKYKEVLDGRDFKDLVDHNIIDGSEQELEFVLHCAAKLLTAPAIGTALDVCCGAGTMTETLRRAGFVATGLELNADAVRLAEQRFPGCNFVVGNAAALDGAFASESFDLILIREGHPFSRIDDFVLQRKLLEDYLRLLRPGGLLVIAHARRGGGMRYPSLDFARVRQTFRDEGISSAGPIFFFLMKHLRCRPGSPVLIYALSFATRVLQYVMAERWIEFLFLSRPKASAARQE